MNRNVNLSSLTATYDGATFHITSLYWDRTMRCYCYTTDDPRNPGTTAQQQVSKYIRCFTAEYFPYPADWNDAVFSQLRGYDITAIEAEPDWSDFFPIHDPGCNVVPYARHDEPDWDSVPF